MAKYDVSHSCGHTETVHLVGPEADRQRKIAWLRREGRCSACRESERREAAAVEASGHREALAGETLPALDGTAAQIAWAEDLRLRLAPDLVALRDLIAAHAKTAATPEAAAVTDLIRLVLAQSAAKWWIDHTQRADVATVLAALLDRRVAAGAIEAALAERIRPAMPRFAAAIRAHA